MATPRVLPIHAVEYFSHCKKGVKICLVESFSDISGPDRPLDGVFARGGSFLTTRFYSSSLGTTLQN